MQINLQKHISLFIILIILLFNSCSFNKLFLQPTKIPATTKKATLKAEKDTVTVYFSGETHQPYPPQTGSTRVADNTSGPRPRRTADSPARCDNPAPA